MSLESLESDCKRTRLNLSYESIKSEVSPETELAFENLREEGPSDRPESPAESVCSDVFIVEEPTTHEESIPSSEVAAEYLERVQQEDSDSYFVTPPAL